jgi:hypothetical protein
VPKKLFFFSGVPSDPGLEAFAGSSDVDIHTLFVFGLCHAPGLDFLGFFQLHEQYIHSTFIFDLVRCIHDG